MFETISCFWWLNPHRMTRSGIWPLLRFSWTRQTQVFLIIFITDRNQHIFFLFRFIKKRKITFSFSSSIKVTEPIIISKHNLHEITFQRTKAFNSSSHVHARQHKTHAWSPETCWTASNERKWHWLTTGGQQTTPKTHGLYLFFFLKLDRGCRHADSAPISRFKNDPAASRWQPRDINDMRLNYSHFLLSPVLLMKTKKHIYVWLDQSSYISIKFKLNHFDYFSKHSFKRDQSCTVDQCRWLSSESFL